MLLDFKALSELHQSWIDWIQCKGDGWVGGVGSQLQSYYNYIPCMHTFETEKQPLYLPLSTETATVTCGNVFPKV